MKKLATYFFVTLGVIFFVILCAGAYVWFADPFGIRPLITMITSKDSTPTYTTTPGSTESTVVTPSDKNPALTTEQEKALESIGIDPASLPTSITPEMEACFVKKLGTTRVQEIKNGDTPTAAEVFTARACYE